MVYGNSHCLISQTYLLVNILVGISGQQLACNTLMIEKLFSALCTNRGLTGIPDSIPIGINAMHFENNSLEVLRDNTLQNFGALKHLFLGFNKIREIEHEAFFGVKNLLVLDLEANQLTHVPYNTFHDFRSLIYLNLKRNPLKRIQGFAFPGLQMLETLELSHCQIASVDPSAFLGLNNLKELNLAYNKITTLEPKMHETLSHSLRTIRLYGNPWNCDCNLRWLKVWLMMAHLNWIFEKSGVTFVPKCSTPHGLNKGKWNKLKIDFFACLPSIWTSQTAIASSEGYNITLSCNIYSHPKGKVRWFKDGELLQEKSLYNIITSSQGDFNFTSELPIVDTSKNNTGVYQCEASNFAGRVVSQITLGIQTPYDPLTFKFDIGAIAGIVVAGVILLLMLCLTVILCRRRQRRQRTYAAKKSLPKSVSNTSELSYTNRREIYPDHRESLSSFKIQANPFYTDQYRLTHRDDSEKQRIFVHGNDTVAMHNSPMKPRLSPVPPPLPPSDYVTIKPNNSARDWMNKPSPYENDSYHWSPAPQGNKPTTFRPYSTFSHEGHLSGGEDDGRMLDSFNHTLHNSTTNSVEDEGGYVYGTVV